MNLPHDFLAFNNFDLAFTRTVRAGNKEFKRFYRYLFPSYNLSLKENLADLISDLRRGTYEPESPTVVYQPKASGVLRPLALLALRDLIVYQAILNRIAVAFEAEQAKYALKHSFGALFAGKSSPFFYRSWKISYSKYNHVTESAYAAGNEHVADFDLVSFYELIDHNLLYQELRKRVKSDALLQLLLTCLRKWTATGGSASVRHGIPQGPEPSAFLAECILFRFDAQRYPKVKYLRYIDDIRLMAKDEVPLRRALLRLDLQSKSIGLIPQAQKIGYRHVQDPKEILKVVPSALATTGIWPNEIVDSKVASGNQTALSKMLRVSLKGKDDQTTVVDVTQFKFAIYRLEPKRHILRRIAPLLVRRPDLSWALSAYIQRFPRDREAADILLAALARDPTYDASAANYIDAMDTCEPEDDHTKYRRVIETAHRRSEERSITLRIAMLRFRGRRRSATEALKLIAVEPDARVRGLVIHSLFGSDRSAIFPKSLCRSQLITETESSDPDLARYSAALLLDVWPWFNPVSWTPSRRANRSVALLMQSIGLRQRAPKKKGVLDLFFRNQFKIAIPISWRKALGRDWRETERRCLKLQELIIGDPTSRITLLDTFNELLLQNISARHPQLKAAFVAATGKGAKFPDLGNWLTNGALKGRLPKASQWFLQVHDARVRGEFAHAKGKKTGLPTRPISYRQAEKLMQGAQSAWAELILEWRSIL